MILTYVGIVSMERRNMRPKWGQRGWLGQKFFQHRVVEVAPFSKARLQQELASQKGKTKKEIEELLQSQAAWVQSFYKAEIDNEGTMPICVWIIFITL